MSKIEGGEVRSSPQTHPLIASLVTVSKLRLLGLFTDENERVSVRKIAASSWYPGGEGLGRGRGSCFMRQLLMDG